jgi:hypothetical protein
MDRGRDAMDVFTLTIGSGGGAKVRAGPLQVGALRNIDLAGVRAGRAFVNGNGLAENEDICAPYPLTGFGYRNYGAYWARESFGFGHDRFCPEPGRVAEQRGKTVRASGPFPLVFVDRGPSYYTQMEAAAGLGVTLRLGLNPGEWIDFLVGWFRIDLFADDIEAGPGPPHEPERRAPPDPWERYRRRP